MTPDQKDLQINEILSYLNNPDNPKKAARALAELSGAQLGPKRITNLADQLENHAREVMALQHMALVIQVGVATISGCPIPPRFYPDSRNKRSIMGINIDGKESWYPYNPLGKDEVSQLKFGYDPNDGSLYNRLTINPKVRLNTDFSVIDTTFGRNWRVKIEPTNIDIPNYPGLAQYAVGMITENSAGQSNSIRHDLKGPYYEVNEYYANRGLIDPKEEIKAFREIKHAVGSVLSKFFTYENTQRRGIIWQSQVD